MFFSNVDFNVIYVDPSIETAGDGTTPTTALSDLPQTLGEFANDSCFIIRRTSEDYAVNLISGTSTLITNVLFLGMPNSADLMYDFVPEEAKTAWGNDEAVYANMKSTQSAYFGIPNISHFLLHRIYLFRDGNAVSNYIFYFYNTSSYNSCISLEHCKFGYKGINLDDSSYASDKITANYLRGYVYTYYTKMLNIKDVIMNFINNSGNTLHGIYCRFSEILNMEDVNVYTTTGTYSNGYYPLYLSDQTTDGIECSIFNIKEIVRFNGNSEYMPTLMQVQGYINAVIENISIEFGEELNSDRPSNLYIASSTIMLNYLKDYSLKNVDINIPYCWNISSSSANVIRMYRCYAGTYVPGVLKEISNINIIMGDDDEVGIGSPNTYANVINSDDDYVAMLCQFDYNDCSNFYKVPIVDNINISNPRGRSLYINNARLTNTTLKGSMTCYYTLADIDLLESWYTGYVLWAYTGSSVRVKELKVNLENASQPYNEEPAIGTTFSNDANVFVDKSNIALSSSSPYSNDNDQIYQGFICNNEGEDGHFIQKTPNGICDTWSVHREGGSTATLKIYNNSYNSSRTMVLGRKPFNGIQLLPTTTGRHIIKAYIAYKGYLSETEMNKRFFISATINAENGKKTYYSSLSGRWVDDSESVWVNDENLTQKCLEMPLDLPNAEAVDIRIYFSWYSASGFVYVDPDIKLEAETEV